MSALDDDPPNGGAGRLDAWPTFKQRSGVEHAVRQVLDALAPERTPPRRVEPRGTVQRYRSPRGCILQGEAWAVSVSWFPAAPDDGTLGELRVISWAGIVSRPGATQRAAGGARPVAETLLHPVESAPHGWSWRAGDGTMLDSDAIAARCLGFLSDHAPGPGDVDTEH